MGRSSTGDVEKEEATMLAAAATRFVDERLEVEMEEDAAAAGLMRLG